MNEAQLIYSYVNNNIMNRWNLFLSDLSCWFNCFHDSFHTNLRYLDLNLDWISCYSIYVSKRLPYPVISCSKVILTGQFDILIPIRHIDTQNGGEPNSPILIGRTYFPRLALLAFLLVIKLLYSYLIKEDHKLQYSSIRVWCYQFLFCIYYHKSHEILLEKVFILKIRPFLRQSFIVIFLLPSARKKSGLALEC